LTTEPYWFSSILASTMCRFQYIPVHYWNYRLRLSPKPCSGSTCLWSHHKCQHLRIHLFKNGMSIMWVWLPWHIFL
jgi:hypothetical protein